MVQEHLL